MTWVQPPGPRHAGGGCASGVVTMRVTFVLPGPASRPVGGVRTVYRLAAALADRGHSTTIVHPVSWLGGRPPGALRRYASWARHASARDFTPRGWLPAVAGVRLRLVPRLTPRWIGPADVVVATGWRTMSPVVALPSARVRRLAYLQHLEDWDGGREAVLEAWRLPLEKVVVSRWLLRELAAIGERGTVVPNGVDHDLFFTAAAPERRPGPSVAFAAHGLAWKGTAIAVAALERVRTTWPSLVVEAFAPEPLELPPWVRLTVDPRPAELRALYNRAQVFLAPSLSEGWDLPACEAMACGAALVASALPVREEYAEDGTSALLVPPGDATAMAAAAERLLHQHALRHALARAGSAGVAGLTWQRSAALFEELLMRRDR